VSACPHDFTLERHLAGELPVESDESKHVTTCPLCSERLDRMRADGAAYMASPAADGVRRELASVSRRKSAPSWQMVAWSVAAPLAAAAAWLALARTRPPDASDLTSKGAATVQLMVGHEGAIVPWSGASLAKGDRLQLSWTSSVPRYVAVIGREDSGATERWFPPDAHAARLEAGTRAFGDSLRFDPPFHGTVYVLVGDAPFDTAPLEAAIRDHREPVFPGRTSILAIPQAP